MPAPVYSAPKGTALARIAIARARSDSDIEAAHFLKHHYPGMPALHEAVFKAAVAGGSAASWGSALRESGAVADFLAAVREVEILGRLSVRRVPFDVSVPIMTNAFSFGWVSLGAAIPVQAAAFETTTLVPLKLGVICPFTNELLRAIRSGAEEAVRVAMVTGAAASADSAVLDPTLTASTNLRPASLTNGAVEIVASGSNTTALSTDLERLMAAVTTNSGTAHTWIMQRRVFAKILLAYGQPVVPPNPQFLGHPVVLSNSVPDTLGSPATDSLIVFCDPGAIILADDGADVSASMQATLEMSDAPSGSSLTPTPVTQTSLFQVDSSAVRLVRQINWARAGASVAYMRVPL